jgi:hypothetical protein
MSSTLTCFLFKAFVTKMLELHRGNATFSIQKQHERHVLAMVQSSSRETVHSCHTAHTGHGGCNVQNEEEMLDAVYANPLTRSQQVTYETGLPQNPQNVVLNTLHEEQINLFHVQLVKGLQLEDDLCLWFC